MSIRLLAFASCDSRPGCCGSVHLEADSLPRAEDALRLRGWRKKQTPTPTGVHVGWACPACLEKP